MLNRIREALKEFEDGGYEYRYGPVTQMAGQWNFIVVTRGDYEAKGPDIIEKYTVILTHEGFIPEHDEYRLIEAVSGATRMLYKAPQFDMFSVGETGALVESATIEFSRAVKAHRGLAGQAHG